MRRLRIIVSTLGMISFVLLSGCTATDKAKIVVNNLNDANTEAKQLITQLKNKEIATLELTNDYIASHHKNTEHHLAQAYHKQLSALYKEAYQSEIKLNELQKNGLAGCVNVVDSDSQVLTESVKIAEQQASDLLQESKKNPTDKILKAQAASAAADYFGRLQQTQQTSHTKEAQCKSKVTKEITTARTSIKEHITEQQSKLSSLRESINLTNNAPIKIKASTNVYEALESWTTEQNIAFNQIDNYLSTIDILSEDGVITRAIDQAGSGFITGIFGSGNNKVGVKAIKSSAVTLFNTIAPDIDKKFNDFNTAMKGKFSDIIANTTASLLGINK